MMHRTLTSLDFVGKALKLSTVLHGDVKNQLRIEANDKKEGTWKELSGIEAGHSELR